MPAAALSRVPQARVMTLAEISEAVRRAAERRSRARAAKRSGSG